MGKLSKDRRDIYYRKAKEDGYRARSAYKLLQIDDQFNLLSLKSDDGSFRVVDLCAAPGSWSQVIRKRLLDAYQQSLIEFNNPAPENLPGDDNQQISCDSECPNLPRSSPHSAPSPPLIVAVDLQEMSPIDGVIQIQGDITSRLTADEILSKLGGKLAHVVVCDGAPDVTGLHDIDEYIQNQLLFAAVRLAAMVLQPGASFAAKVFRGEQIGLQMAQLEVFFKEVYCCKPSSSRNSSLEAFVVCRGFRYPMGFEPSRFPSHTEFKDVIWKCIEKAQTHPKSKLLEYNSTVVRCLDSLDEDHTNFSTNDDVYDNNEKEFELLEYVKMTTVPFAACGDLQGFDSDMTYDVENGHIFLDPEQPPINPPYKLAVNKKRGIAVDS